MNSIIQNNIKKSKEKYIQNSINNLYNLTNDIKYQQH
jgi:hypothetical protein